VHMQVLYEGETSRLDLGLVHSGGFALAPDPCLVDTSYTAVPDGGISASPVLVTIQPFVSACYTGSVSKCV